MQVFKFDGASIKDAEGVKNIAEVFEQFPNQKIGISIPTMRKTFCIFLLFFCFNANAQDKKLDSLWSIYNNKTQADTNRLKAIHKIAWDYLYINPDSTLVFANLELKLSLDKNNQYFEAQALNSIASSYNLKGDYQLALNNYFKSLVINQKINNKKGIGISYNGIGSIYANQSNFKNALDYFLKSLKIHVELSDKNGELACLSNIGYVYENQLNYSKALEYYFKALKISEHINDKNRIGTCYNNIGSVYYKQKHVKEALKYYFKSLEIRESINDQYGISTCYNNIGSVYLYNSEYKSAEIFLKKNVILSKLIDDKQGLSNSFINLSTLYIKTKQYKMSLCYEDSILQISKEIGDIDNERLAYQNFSETYAKLNNYKLAYEYFVKFKQLTDSIFNIENSEQLSDLKTNFEVDKKEAELQAKAKAQEIVTTEEKKRQQLIIYSVAGMLLLVVIFSIFLYKRFAITRKQNAIIEQQKFIVEQKNHLIEEKHKEITDSINYAERIQRAMLASNLLLKENSRLLSGKDDNYFVLFKPKDVVSGDFYWASKLNQNQFCLVTADSTGHGVPGAIMSMLNMNSLKESITKGLTEADDILNYTRTIIINTLANDGSQTGGKDGMDCSLMIFDYSRLCLSWVAANNPIWVIRNAGQSNCELIELKPQKMPVGKHERQNELFVKQTLQLQKNDIVYAITDGYPDQFGGEKGKKFMSKNLKELLQINAHLSMEAQHELLYQTFKNWVGELEQVDDVTIIGIKI